MSIHVDPEPQQASPATNFYYDASATLSRAGVPFLVGGAYSLYAYTGLARMTKDLDLFILPRDVERARQALEAEGYETELVYSHWLAKARKKAEFIDIIFNSGNGACPVDDEWFAHASDGTVLGLPVKLCPPEESIWQKAFIMERERYDGADVAHILKSRARTLDWRRLIDRFGPHWRVMFSHVLLFGFIYPDEQHAIPQWVMQEFIEKLQADLAGPRPTEHVCGGTLISREQYLPDVRNWGYEDARVVSGNMTPDQVENWTPPGEANGSPAPA
jgi:hypothetical protein